MESEKSTCPSQFASPHSAYGLAAPHQRQALFTYSCEQTSTFAQRLLLQASTLPAGGAALAAPAFAPALTFMPSAMLKLPESRMPVSYPCPMGWAYPLPTETVTVPPRIETVPPAPPLVPTAEAEPPPMADPKVDEALTVPPRIVTVPPVPAVASALLAPPPPMPAPWLADALTRPPLIVTVPAERVSSPPIPALNLVLPTAVSAPMPSPSDCAQSVRLLPGVMRMPASAASSAPSLRMRCTSPETAMRAVFVTAPETTHQPVVSVFSPL